MPLLFGENDFWVTNIFAHSCCMLFSGSVKSFELQWNGTNSNDTWLQTTGSFLLWWSELGRGLQRILTGLIGTGSLWVQRLFTISKENVMGFPAEITVFNREWTNEQITKLWTTKKNVGRPQLCSPVCHMPVHMCVCVCPKTCVVLLAVFAQTDPPNIWKNISHYLSI